MSICSICYSTKNCREWCGLSVEDLQDNLNELEERLHTLLDETTKIIEFYANKDNWYWNNDYPYKHIIKDKDLDKDNIGGNMARSYLRNKL